MDTPFEPNVKTAVQFGAGNVGRGFMGQLFRESGFHTVFVDVDASLVARLNEQGRYPLRLLDAYTRTTREIVIDDFSALCTSEPDKIQHAIADARIVATAVGVKNLEAIAPLLSAGIELRCNKNPLPLDIYLCENLLEAAALLRERVFALLSERAKDWAAANIGFVGTSVVRIVVGAGRSDADDPLLVVADAHYRLPYDGKATRAGEPGIEGFCPVTNFKAEVERKIFTYNLGHAALAYLGYMRGHTYIHETFDDPFVSSIFTGALDETTAALLRRYPVDLSTAEHSHVLRDVRVRFGNPLVRDVITRVARDPIRKLGPNDRLIGAAKLCLEENVFPENIARVCAAVLCYDAPDNPDAVRLARLIDAVGIEETLRKVTGIDPKTPLGMKIIQHYRSIARD